MNRSVCSVIVFSILFVFSPARVDAKDKIDIKKHFKKGLVLYYSFDKKNIKALNMGSSTMHGDIHGASWSPDGKVGGALSFDGYDDYIDTKLRYSKLSGITT